MKIKALVTGGCGYIGSVAVSQLCDLNYEVHVIDNYHNGKYPNKDIRAIYHEIDLLNYEKTFNLFSKFNFSFVMHFAGLTQVKESMEKPYEYLNNNYLMLLNILECMRKHNVKKIIFSSTAAVFGKPDVELISEITEKAPVNPYGYSKLICEKLLKSYELVFEYKYVIFRYFNVAGADTLNNKGYFNNKPTHLIPVLIQNHFTNNVSKIFGNDYKTNDGTCVRDYIHVIDLVKAHVMAIDFLENNKSEDFNLGSNKGYSNLQVIKTLENQLKTNVKYKFEQRRIGDPDKLVTDNKKALTILRWTPVNSSIEKIVEDSIIFYNKNFS